MLEEHRLLRCPRENTLAQMIDAVDLVLILPKRRQVPGHGKLRSMLEQDAKPVQERIQTKILFVEKASQGYRFRILARYLETRQVVEHRHGSRA